MNLTAYAERHEGWWIITVPEIKGLFTQTRRLDQIEAMVKDAASLLTDQPEDAFTVTVIPKLLEETTAKIRALKEAKERLRESEVALATVNREVAPELAAQGLTVRDIGSILDISYQRAAQLIAA